MEEYELIDQQTALQDCIKKLQGSEWLAVDTEFERINTYYPNLCLIQIANLQYTYIIDPLLIDDIQPIYDLLYDKSIIKVLHSAHQDIEILFNLTGNIPMPLFDTQLAAHLFGFNKGLGYANLIKASLDIELDKTQSRTEWKKRPLTQAQLSYAAADVIYLGKVYEQFLAKMTDDINTQLTDIFSVLYQVDTYHPDPSRMWKKIFAARRLHGKALNIAKELAAWREREARKQNLPRKWVLPDLLLVNISKEFPTDMEELTNVKGMQEKMLTRYADEWLTITEKFN